MSRPPGARFAALRPAGFAVSPQEPVATPMVSSTLFPHLPRTYRNPFRIGMAVLLAGLVASALLEWTGPLVILSALGVPALFALYLWESDIVLDLPRHVLGMVAALGIAFGVGWVWFTGGLIARAYGIPVAAGFVLENLAGAGLTIAVGGVGFMVAPAVLVRFLLRHRNRESLDGFVIGALGAMSFTAAAATTRLAPQFVYGLLEHLSLPRRLIEAVLYGLAAPLTAAALGGLIGILLWFRPGRRARRGPPLPAIGPAARNDGPGRQAAGPVLELRARRPGYAVLPGMRVCGESVVSIHPAPAPRAPRDQAERG